VNSCLHGSEGAGTQQCVPATRLVVGARSQSAVATLVDRRTRYLCLVPPREGHSAGQLRDALIPTLSMLPERARRSLTWDQGSEMARQHRPRRRRPAAQEAPATPHGRCRRRTPTAARPELLPPTRAGAWKHRADGQCTEPAGPPVRSPPPYRLPSAPAMAGRQAPRLNPASLTEHAPWRKDRDRRTTARAKQRSRRLDVWNPGPPACRPGGGAAGRTAAAVDVL